MSFVATAVAVVGAATGVASAISQGKQGQKALLMQDVASNLDRMQKAELDKALAKQNNENTKIKILADSVANIRIAQQNALIQTTIASQSAQKEADKRNLVIVGIGGGVIIVGALAVLKL
jgi:hypothetical protein